MWPKDSEDLIGAERAGAASDDALVDAAKRGDVSAFSELVVRYQRSIRTCLAVRLANPHEAEDLAQEVFVTAFAQIARFDGERPFGPWLRGIALNLLRNHQRKFRPEYIGGHEELGRLLEARIGATLQEPRESAMCDALVECLEQIDGSSRALLQRRYGDEVSVRALAEELHRGYSALTMQLHRLRTLLAECVESKMAS